MVLVKAPEDASGDELTQGCTSPAHILAIGEMSLFIQEVGTIHQQAVD